MDLNFKQSLQLLLNQIKVGSIQNELTDQKLRCFVEALTGFSKKEFNLYEIFRVLSHSKIEIKSEIKNSASQEGCELLNRIATLIQIEIKVTVMKLKKPGVNNMENNDNRDVPELLIWSDDKIDLIELIYGTARSIENGNTSMKKIKKCYEYFFQIDLGNIYDALGDLNIRKEGPCAYLESLPGNLRKKIDQLNSK